MIRNQGTQNEDESKGRVLVIDDDPGLCQTMELDLSQRHYDVVWKASSQEGLDEFQSGDFDVVLTDLNMPGLNGLELCQKFVSLRPDIPVLLITAFGSLETAIEAIRAGAYNFITKPVEFDLLEIAIAGAVRHRSLLERLQRLEQSLENSKQFESLLGESAEMHFLFDQLNRVAPTDVSVLISGESGTGKELVAKAIHKRSQRGNGPFVAINCAALPASLLESELFGHEKGSFTGATSSKKGLFAQADKGTIFLDEIGEFPVDLQATLLRALAERRARPIGGQKEYRFDVRVLSATNRDLELEIEEGRFREDLFFRLNVIQLTLPPLRSRGTDILLLAQHFLNLLGRKHHRNVQSFTQPVARKLLDYHWPGNVRELRNTIERALVLTRFDKLTVDDLPDKIQAFKKSQWLLHGADPSELLPMRDIEKRYILHVLKEAKNNKSLAAKMLGFDRKTLYRKLEIYDVK